MRIHPLALASALLIPAIVLSARTTKPRKHASGPIKSAKEAKAIAEQETGGKVTSARRIPLNGASGGWEVDCPGCHGECLRCGCYLKRFCFGGRDQFPPFEAGKGGTR